MSLILNYPVRVQCVSSVCGHKRALDFLGPYFFQVQRKNKTGYWLVNATNSTEAVRAYTDSRHNGKVVTDVTCCRLSLSAAQGFFTKRGLQYRGFISAAPSLEDIRIEAASLHNAKTITTPMLGYLFGNIGKSSVADSLQPLTVEHCVAPFRENKGWFSKKQNIRILLPLNA